jgi:hypothetical protein
MKIYVGLDLGVNKTALCCVDEMGETLLEPIFRLNLGVSLLSSEHFQIL